MVHLVQEVDLRPGLREADHVLDFDGHPHNLQHDHLHQVSGDPGRTAPPFLSLSRPECPGTFASWNEGCQLQKAERGVQVQHEASAAETKI